MWVGGCGDIHVPCLVDQHRPPPPSPLPPQAPPPRPDWWTSPSVKDDISNDLIIWSRNDINKISPDSSIMDFLGVRGQPGHHSRMQESGVASRG